MSDWTQTLKALHATSVRRYAGGDVRLAGWFDRKDEKFLDSIGARPIHLFDYAEDFAGDGEPVWETVLLLMAIRREFFLFEQHGKWSGETLDAATLPPKSASLHGIEWLPRILVKARAYLKGAETPGIMFGCGGDRAFWERHAIHPADFLRAVWRSEGDNDAVVRLVQSAKA